MYITSFLLDVSYWQMHHVFASDIFGLISYCPCAEQAKAGFGFAYVSVNIKSKGTLILKIYHLK